MNEEQQAGINMADSDKSINTTGSSQADTKLPLSQFLQDQGIPALPEGGLSSAAPGALARPDWRTEVQLGHNLKGKMHLDAYGAEAHLKRFTVSKPVQCS